MHIVKYGWFESILSKLGYSGIVTGTGQSTLTLQRMTGFSGGRLLIYDPDNWTTNPDGSLTIPVLWDSQQWNISFVYNQFNPPIVTVARSTYRTITAASTSTA